MPARGTHIGPNRRRQQRPRLRRRVEGDDARVVNQLVRDRDDTCALDDAHVGVVDGGKHRVGKAAAMHDATDAEAVLVVRVARLAALQATASLHGNRPGLRDSARQTPVGWIDDERCAPRRRVVFAPMRDRRIRRVHFAGEDVDGREIAFVAHADLFDALSILRVGQELSRAELSRSFERHTVLAFTRPLALEIGVAPQRAHAPGSFRVGLCARCGRQPARVHQCRDCQHACGDRRDDPNVHCIAPVDDSRLDADGVLGGCLNCLNFDDGSSPISDRGRKLSGC